MGSALDSGSSGPGSSPGWDNFAVLLGNKLYSHGASPTQEYKWVLVIKSWGVTCDVPASHQGGVRVAILLVSFILMKLGQFSPSTAFPLPYKIKPQKVYSTFKISLFDRVHNMGKRHHMTWNYVMISVVHHFGFAILVFSNLPLLELELAV